MLYVIGEENSIANEFLLELRDHQKQQDKSRFRLNMERLGEIMAYEISKKMSYIRQTIRTPLGSATLDAFAAQPVLIPILRAGIPYFTGFQNFFDRAESGFVGAYRKEGGNSITIQLDYLATPSLTGKDVILIDPMLATGKSVTDTLKQLSTRGTPSHVHLASVVASPEGIQYLEKELNLPFSIWTFAVDERLDPRFYIMPGLGDAGDLSFGEKL